VIFHFVRSENTQNIPTSEIFITYRYIVLLSLLCFILIQVSVQCFLMNCLLAFTR